MNTFALDDAPRRAARSQPEIDSSALSTRAEGAWRRGEALAVSGDIAGSLAWLERAHRLAPSDQNLLFSLAMMRLRAGQGIAAIALFEEIALAHGVRESWAGLAAACLSAGQADRAAGALASALSRNMADAGLLTVAGRVAQAGRIAGWCAMVREGVLRTGGTRAPVCLALDGLPASAAETEAGLWALPSSWREAAQLRAWAGDHELAGSPMSLASIRRVEGFVARTQDGLAGWAWHPGAPECDPLLRITDEAGVVLGEITARDVSGPVEGSSPLARPRGFSASIAAGTVRVQGSDGRDLLGSPLSPLLERRLPLAGSQAPAPGALPGARPGTDVVIPVFRGLETTLACIRSVLATVKRHTRIWVVNDASPEAALVTALQAMADAGSIRMLESSGAGPPRNLGFPSAVNAGLRTAWGRDVVLLNSDTLVAGDWLGLLEDAAYSAADIGTATPLSNDATILSYPETAEPNPVPDAALTARLAALAAQANAGLIVEIPTAHGFCMFIRHDCLAGTGGFEAGLFAQGYGEENDFSERARALGWRHVAVPAAYVAHVGGVSFGSAARMPLLRRNLDTLGQLHPGYQARIARFVASDALAPARRRLDAARWREGALVAGAVLLISHGGGGGTARIVAGRAARIRGQGMRPVILSARDGLCEIDDETRFPNLRYRLPGELPALLALLEGDRPGSAELHHLLGHDHSVTALFGLLRIPFDVHVHDYGWLCPRISLVSGTGRYCGEPPAAACELCVRRWGRAIEDPVAPTTLRARSAATLAAARAVIVPSEDVARRLRRHFPGIRPHVVPWQDDGTLQAASVRRRTGRLRVAVVGGIGVEKGYDVLLACARDAAARDLDITFVLVGYSIDDATLEATGRVFVTGPFKADEAALLIRAQDAHVAFLPSIWPETWCFALSDVWQAGLSAVLFDIGTPAERVRRAGRGWVLPLGLPPEATNDFLLRLANA